MTLLLNRLQAVKHPEVAVPPSPGLQGVHESVAIVIKLLSLHLYLLSYSSFRILFLTINK
jgi:hypothetical protein